MNVPVQCPECEKHFNMGSCHELCNLKEENPLFSRNGKFMCFHCHEFTIVIEDLLSSTQKLLES